MNKTNARKIAETITYDQLVAMFASAKANITDWSVVSAVNPNMSKGTAWNVLFPGVKPSIIKHQLALKNMIWEFGDYLPSELRIKKPSKGKSSVTITHQEPIFD